MERYLHRRFSGVSDLTPEEKAEIDKEIQTAVQIVRDLGDKPRSEVDRVIHVDHPEFNIPEYNIRMVLGWRYGNKPLEKTADPISPTYTSTENIELALFLIFLQKWPHEAGEFVKQAHNANFLQHYQGRGLYFGIEIAANNELISEDRRRPYKCWIAAMDLAQEAKLRYFTSESLIENDLTKSIFKRRDGADIFRGGNMLATE